MKILLAIETSGNSLGVALRSDEGILFEKNVIEGSIHGRALIPLIAECLKEQGLRANDLSAVAVSIGPGSWTGLRIGITAAKTLAWSTGIGLILVPSLESLAWQTGVAVNSPILAIRNARSEGLFCAIFHEQCETSKPSERCTLPQLPLLGRWMDETVLTQERMVSETIRILQKKAVSNLTLCGDAVCMTALTSIAQEHGWMLRRDVEHVNGGAVAECGWRRLHAGLVLSEAQEIHKVAPLYLRASDPEIKLRNLGLNLGTPYLYQ